MSNKSKDDIVWDADVWFTKHHLANASDDFKDWWVNYYGPPECNNMEDQHEYWVRCGFALIGWNAQYKIRVNSIACG